MLASEVYKSPMFRYYSCEEGSLNSSIIVVCPPLGLVIQGSPKYPVVDGGVYWEPMQEIFREINPEKEGSIDQLLDGFRGTTNLGNIVYHSRSFQRLPDEWSEDILRYIIDEKVPSWIEEQISKTVEIKTPKKRGVLTRIFYQIFPEKSPSIIMPQLLKEQKMPHELFFENLLENMFVDLRDALGHKNQSLISYTPKGIEAIQKIKSRIKQSA